MRILTLSTKANGGGAERVAKDLTLALREMGHQAHIRVRWDQPAEGDLVSPVPFSKAGLSLTERANYYVRRAVQELGIELISSPALPRLFDDLPFEPGIIHLHNFRENFLRLADLEALCRRAPVVWTWHDMWPMTGHCAHSLDCRRWAQGCGKCPYLDAYVALRTDFSRLNRARRKGLYRRIANRCPGRLRVVCPSLWLERLAAEGCAEVLETAHVPNGVDQSVFRPPAEGDRIEARRRMKAGPWPPTALYAAHSGRKNLYKDYECLSSALSLLRQKGSDLMGLVAGDRDVKEPRLAEGELSLGEVRDRREMATVYGVADFYVHPTRADTYPLTVIEAMSCGLPVIASRVGGLPEMVQHGRTGLLVEPGNPRALAEAMSALATRDDLRRRMGQAAHEAARDAMSLERMAKRYEQIYEEIRGAP